MIEDAHTGKMGFIGTQHFNTSLDIVYADKRKVER